MISTDFAPNETWGDAWQSFKTLFQPWQFVKGEFITKVKRRLYSYFPNSNIFLFLTGRAALYQFLRSLCLKKGDEVLVQAFTCEAVVLPILAHRLKPIYVDIETETFSMDFTDLEKKLTPKIKVLILQHTFGFTPINRDKILSFVKKNRLFVIEDLAHGFPNASTISNQQSAILLSFGRSKALSSVFGGAIVTQNKNLSKRLKLLEKELSPPSLSFILRTLLYKPIVMLIKSTYNLMIGKVLHKTVNGLHLLPLEITQKEKDGEYDDLFNKTYPNALAKTLLYQLNKFDRIQNNRKIICDFYQKNVTRYMLHVIPRQARAFGSEDAQARRDNAEQSRSITCSLLRYPLLVDNRDEIINKARKQNIFLGKWYDQVVAPKSLDLRRVGYTSNSCPTAEKICEKIINLSTNINIKETERIVKILNDVK